MSKSSQTTDKELRFLSENLGVSVSMAQAAQLNAFNDLLIKWTQRFNLVSANTLSDSITRHVLDALSIDPYLPVLPLAIANPDLSFASVETNGKKIRFQRQVLMELGLNNVELLHSRIESADVHARNVTSRAFTAPAAFLEVASRCSAPTSQAIIMLGHAERLPDTLPKPWTLKTLHAVDVPGEFGARHVAVCIRGTLHP